MKSFAYNKLLIAFILLGLMAAIAVNLTRLDCEARNNTIDLVVDYEGLLELAEREGIPSQRVLADAKQAGITSLAVYERSFKKLNLNGKAAAISGAELISRRNAGYLNSSDWNSLIDAGTVVGTDVYVTGHDELTFRELKEDIGRRLGRDRVRSLAVDGREVLAVKAQYESFIKMDLGLPTDEMSAVNDAGFFVVARPSNYSKVSAADVEAVFARLDGFKVSELIFSGKLALGYPDELKLVAKELARRKITLGLIEAPTQLQFYRQDGLLDIAKDVDYRAARMYSIDKAEQEKMTVVQAIERWKNTDEERNIRVSLLHIFRKPTPGKTLYETNMEYFSGVRDILSTRWYVFGPAGVFTPLEISPWLRSLVVMGIIAACVLYLSLVLPWLNVRPKYQIGLFAVLTGIAIAPIILGYGNTIRLVSALASANVFPALAMISLLDYIRAHKTVVASGLPRIVLIAIPCLLVTGALSFAGALFLSGSISDVEFFLEVNIFRGVKLTFILPIVLVAIAFLQRFAVFGTWEDDVSSLYVEAQKLLNTTVTVKTLAMLGVALLALVVFIARSGHNMGMPVPGIELKIRAFLEQTLYARPRSKEMFIGHPAFMLMIMAWRKKWPTMLFFTLVLVATIAQGSMVETFAHMRTPFLMSAVRGLGGIILGGCIGVALMTAVAFCQTVWERAYTMKEFRA